MAGTLTGTLSIALDDFSQKALRESHPQTQCCEARQRRKTATGDLPQSRCLAGDAIPLRR
jgi:hypothetical protein